MGKSGRLRIAAALVSLAVVAAGCDGDDSPRSQGSRRPGSPSPKSLPSSPNDGKGDKKDPKKEEELTKRVPGGATLVSLPPKAEEICTRGRPLSVACPLLVPQVEGTSYLVETFGRPGGRFQVLELAAGAPSNRNLARNAPPRVSHVVVETGKPGFLIDIGEPQPTDQSLEQVLAGDRDGAVIVQPEPSWDWDAELILAPAFPSGGAHGDHLMYKWKQGGHENIVSLHVWTPAAEAVRTLHAIVRSAKSP